MLNYVVLNVQYILKRSYEFETIQMSERKNVYLDGLGDDSVVDILFGCETDFVG
jgi:hypothetical protein